MESKLIQYQRGIIDTVWSSALILVPLFFNVYSSRIFEPDKVAIIRSLSLLILAAGLIIVINKIIQLGFKNYLINTIIPAWKKILHTPILVFILGFLIINVISTLFSVAPNTSFWGSYQRSQGTYTTISYLIFFASIYVLLVKRNQVEKIITIAIITSLPVSLYGIIQRFGLDPIQWAGNVTSRIAANMGNSIFIAAFLIIVFPLTVRRIMITFSSIMHSESALLVHFLKATFYVLIAVIQLVAIYFSGSRGPWLGLGTSLLVFWLGISLIWKKKWLAYVVIILGSLAIIFLLVLNIPGGPLKSLRELPGIGRLGQLFDAESRTGKVRTLIWQGAANLVLPHDPLVYPDQTTDKFNIIRPLIGYGSESMYVAYNRFYPSDLTLVEKRNASPDRSHNEVWDSLVFTGIIGLLFFLLIFGSIFYYGFIWLGMVENQFKRYLLIAFMLAGGIIGSILVFIYKGFSFIGVGLPFGMITGVIFFIIYQSIFGIKNTSYNQNKTRQLIILSLLASFSAHFVELIFGFGIASTRLYFWQFLGLLVIIGNQQIDFTNNNETIQVDQTGNSLSLDNRIKTSQTKSKSKSSVKRQKVNTKDSKFFSYFKDINQVKRIITYGLLFSIILITLSFDFITNSEKGDSSSIVLNQSLILKFFQNSGFNIGTIIILFVTWIVGGFILVTDTFEFRYFKSIASSIFGVLVVSILIYLFYSVWHFGGLTSVSEFIPQTKNEILSLVELYRFIPLRFYIAILLLIFLIPFGMVDWNTRKKSSILEPILSPILFVFFILVSFFTNVRLIQADVTFKAADSFTRPGLWSVAVDIYNQAIKIAPKEDYYYLFLARASLEQARSEEDQFVQNELFKHAETEIIQARKLNPLNTDHTANLARLYDVWATYSTDKNLKEERYQKSRDLYDDAIMLSPNNSRIWGELASLLFEIGSRDEAFQKLDHALSLDPTYDWLYSTKGDFYSQIASEVEDKETKTNYYQSASENYSQALRYSSSSDIPNRYRILFLKGSVLTHLQNYNEAIQTYEEALKVQPSSTENWRIYGILAKIYYEIGEKKLAIEYAKQALSVSPEEQKSQFEEYLKEIERAP